MGRTKTCPVCGETMYEETTKFYDYWTGITTVNPTGEYHCPHCEEVAEKYAKEQAQKRYEEKCRIYDREYQEYLDIRQYDTLFTIQLTFEELQALKGLRGKQNRFNKFTVRCAYDRIDSATSCDWRNTVTEKQRNCIKLIEKNTKHKFYGRTKESAREFISKYIEESQGYATCLNINMEEMKNDD